MARIGVALGLLGVILGVPHDADFSIGAAGLEPVRPLGRNALPGQLAADVGPFEFDRRAARSSAPLAIAMTALFEIRAPASSRPPRSRR